MKLVALTLVAATLLGAPGAPSGDAIDVHFWAIHAYNTGQKVKLDKRLDDIRSALGDVKFDTLRLLKMATLKVPYSKEAKTGITEEYALHVRPLSKEAGGRIKIQARVTMSRKEKKDGKPINAVGVTALAVPGQRFKLRGVPLEQGELVIVLSVKE